VPASGGCRRKKGATRMVAMEERFGVEGHGFRTVSEVDRTRAQKPCASARHHWRCYTRGKYSALSFTSHEFPVRTTNWDTGAWFFRGAGTPVANHVTKGGTVNRPSAPVSHRKQSAAHMQGRNVPVHGLRPILPRPQAAIAAESVLHCRRANALFPLVATRNCIEIQLMIAPEIHTERSCAA
jgi:hypothetical protein